MFNVIYPIVEEKQNELWDWDINDDGSINNIISINRIAEDNVQLNIKQYKLTFQKGYYNDSNQYTHINVYMHTAKHSVKKMFIFILDGNKWVYKKCTDLNTTYDLTEETIGDIVKKFVKETEIFK